MTVRPVALVAKDPSACNHAAAVSQRLAWLTMLRLTLLVSGTLLDGVDGGPRAAARRAYQREQLQLANDINETDAFFAVGSAALPRFPPFLVGIAAQLSPMS